MPMDIKDLTLSHSEITPLLVRLHESERLYSLAKDRNPLAKIELTGAVLALLDIELNGSERELLADVLIDLVRQAEKDLRQALAERLSVVENAPLRLVLWLANDEISVAEPILRKSLVFSDLDLIYIVKSKGPDYWQAIAARENLSAQLIDMLADTGDMGTVIAMSENERITLTRHAIAIMADMARSNEALARPLLMRPEIPESLARSMYSHVGQELQNYIRAYYNVTDGLEEVVFRDVILEFEEAGNSEFMPTEEMLLAAAQFAETGKLTIHLLMETLQRGQISSFIALFSRFSGVSAQRIHDFLRQPNPKGLAIACRAFGVQKSDFSRIYLMTHRMRSKGRFVNQEELKQSLTYFDKIRPEIAERIIWRSGHRH